MYYLDFFYFENNLSIHAKKGNLFNYLSWNHKKIKPRFIKTLGFG